MENIINENTINLALGFMKNFSLSLLIFFIGKLIVRKVIRIIKEALTKKNIDKTLIVFSCNVLHGISIAFLVIASLSQLGIQTSSLAAVIAAAGLAIGLAFQSSLSNIASGIMIIVFKPFVIGHFIEAGGVVGTVEEVGIFHTKLRTSDNKSIISPNSNIIAGKIINYSIKETRRIDMVFGCSYEDNIKNVKEVIQRVLNEEERVLKDPAPVVGVLELADSSINFVVRPWVKKGDYFDVKLDLNEKIKLAFDEEGISMPYPQRDVNIKNPEKLIG